MRNETLNLLYIFSWPGYLISFILICISYYMFATRTKNFIPNRNITSEELYRIIKEFPNSVFNNKVKQIKSYRNNMLRLDCSTVKIIISVRAEKIICRYTLNSFINFISAVFFCLCIYTAFDILSEHLLFGYSQDSAIVYFAVALGVHILRSRILNRGRNIIKSLEEHLR